MNKKGLLFELVRTSVLEESGDGGVIIVSQQYEKLAKDFLEYENKLDEPYFIRKKIVNNGSAIAFCPEEKFAQEAIIFSCDTGIKSLDFYELVIFSHDIFE